MIKEVFNLSIPEGVFIRIRIMIRQVDSKKVAKAMATRERWARNAQRMMQETNTKKVVKMLRIGSKGMAAVSIIALCSACTGFGANQMFTDSDAGFVMLAGDAEGIRAYNDGINGVITNTKSSPDVKSSYWQNRDQETAVKGLKFRVNKKD